MAIGNVPSVSALDKSDKTNELRIDGMTFAPLLAAERIEERTREIADELRREYAGKSPVFVCVLNGSYLFFADLTRAFGEPCEIDFVKIKSYGNATTSSGVVKLIKDVDAKLEERHVVLVEDVVDSGLSLTFLVDHFKRKKPASIRTVSLLRKPKALTYNAEIDYIGFDIPENYVVGYGLDIAQRYRNLSAIYAAKE
jgi:hypoxanthine phosphoribosyltransferase